MPLAVERKLLRLERLEPESGLPEGSMPLSPDRIRRHAANLYGRVDYLIHSPNRSQRILPIKATLRDYRNDPRVRESFVLKLENEGTTEVYTFLFGNDRSVSIHRRVESASLPINSQPWEKMAVRLSVKEDSSVVTHESQGIYSKGEDQMKNLAERNNSTAVARAEMLVERINGLWSSGEQRMSAVQKQVKRRLPFLEKLKTTPEDLFNQIKNFADSSKSPGIAKFKKEYSDSDVIILDLTAGPNGEYTDVYTIELGREAGVAIAIMYRRRNLGFQPIGNQPWEQLKILISGDETDEYRVIHRSCGIKGYGDANEAVEVEGTTARARGESLVRRFKYDFDRNTSGRVTSLF